MFLYVLANDIQNSEQPPETTPSNSPTTITDSDIDGGEQWPELNFDNTYNTIFTSFVIASAAAVLIIVLLLLCTCYLGKGLCQERHQCLYKICCCCFSEQKKKNKKGKSLLYLSKQATIVYKIMCMYVYNSVTHSFTSIYLQGSSEE